MSIDFIFILCLLSRVINSDRVSVKTKQGVIIGKRESTVFNEMTYYAFYGVPYAQPPIGKLRFKNPVYTRKWERPFDATTEYHGACVQEHIVHKDKIYGSEDCLYLNIYTPELPNQNNKNLKSIIIWIHGYAFGNSFSHIHGPDFLIENDIIFITLTHRLGVFGFIKLYQNDSNANMGLKDVAMGLRWIHKNVEFFGGNRNEITVMGSGSACAYLTLLLATKYNKLFTKMIMQSGSVYSPSLFQGNETYEKVKLKKELRTKGFKNILKAPTKEIISASTKIYNKMDLLNSQRPLVPFLPIREANLNESLLTKDLVNIYRDIEKKCANKSILIGYTSQESISEMIPFIHNPQYMKTFTNAFKFMVPFLGGCKYRHGTKDYEKISTKIKNYYVKNELSNVTLSDFLKLTSDLYKYPIFKFINSLFSAGKDKIFVYNFNYIGKLNVVKATSMANTNIKIKGAAQGDEICYILKCEPLWEAYVNLKLSPNDLDAIFIKEISQMWANFAKFSNPSVINNNDIKWLPTTLNKDYIFHFSKSHKLTDSKNEKKMVKFWNEIYDQYYADVNCKKFRDEL